MVCADEHALLVRCCFIDQPHVAAHEAGHLARRVPNIVKMHEYFEEEKVVHVVLDFCVGGDMLEFIQNKGAYGGRGGCSHRWWAPLRTCTQRFWDFERDGRQSVRHHHRHAAVPGV